MVTASGIVTQSANGQVLTFTDTSTGIGTLVSRILVIYNSSGAILTTINMGATLTATYNITVDGYFSFVETIIDNTGTYVATVNYLSTSFYDIAFSNTLVQLGCDCNCGSEKLTMLDISQLFKVSAERFALGGLGSSAQQSIVTANAYLTGN